jgi:hypothetical protein
VQLRFQKVISVSSATGKMTFKAWLRLSWDDDRLRWDPALYGGITSTQIHAYELSSKWSKIWTPDLAIFNSEGSLSGMMESQHATVYNTGHVFWSRPGIFTITCKFSGLVAFPWDELRCVMDMGAWNLAADLQGLAFKPCDPATSSIPCGPGWQVSNMEPSSGESYQQHGISTVRSTHGDYYCAHLPLNILHPLLMRLYCELRM